jgi:3-deoxy-D-manno-octulosonic-acid transferase
LQELKRDQKLGAILVPHEPTPEHLAQLEDAASAAGLNPTRLSQLIELSTHQRRSTAAAKDPDRWRCIVVDAVGVLADIYRSTILSYVGGSFSTGVHNVLEPAVCGQPVLFGPRIHNAYEAERLVERSAGFVLKTPKDAQAVLSMLLGDEDARARAGETARDFVLSQSGATEASVALLREAVFKSGVHAA